MEEAPGGQIAEKVALLPAPVQTTTPDQVRGLLEPDGALHNLVDDALELGEQGPVLLARSVARKLGGEPEEYVEAVKVALMETWRTEKEVA